jgi:hypothetical protein
LISGGLFVWLESSSASNGAAAGVTTTAQARVTTTTSAAVTPQTFAVTGTATTLKSTITATRQEGSHKIVRMTQQGVIAGGITGLYTNEEILTLSTDSSGTLSGKITCTCTVAGKSGTLMWVYTGTQAADGSFQGQFFDLQGTGDLARLHGQGMFQGQEDHLTYSSELHFDF